MVPNMGLSRLLGMPDLWAPEALVHGFFHKPSDAKTPCCPTDKTVRVYGGLDVYDIVLISALKRWKCCFRTTCFCLKGNAEICFCRMISR